MRLHYGARRRKAGKIFVNYCKTADDARGLLRQIGEALWAMTIVGFPLLTAEQQIFLRCSADNSPVR